MLRVEKLWYDKWVQRPGIPLTVFVSKYRKLYRLVDNLFKEFDPCQIANGRCAQTGGDFCCSHCEFLSETGCTTNSMWCKLWMCHTAGQNMKDIGEFGKRWRVCKATADKLCMGHGGRYGLNQYILNFYGPTEYDKWLIKEN